MNDASNVVSFAKRKKALPARSALAYLVKVAESHPEDVVEVESITHLGVLLGWERPRTSKQLKAWETSGQVTVDRADTGKLVIRILPGRDDLERAGTPSQGTRARSAGGTRAKRATKRAVDRADERAIGRAVQRAGDRVNVENTDDRSEPYTDQLNAAGTQNMRESLSENVPANVPSGTPHGTVNGTPSEQLIARANRDVVYHAEDVIWPRADGGERRGNRAALGGGHASFASVAAYLTAFVLALIAAWFSVRGMIVLFPGDPTSALALGVGLETAKIATVGFVAAWWGRLAWFFRITLVLLACGCEVLNASGVFGQLVIAHLQKGAMAEASFERTDAETSGKIDVAQGRLADLDRQIATIDSVIDSATRNGNPKQTARVRREQEPGRAKLVIDRDKVRQELAAVKTSRSRGSAQHKVDEAETAPVVWAARMVGIDRDPEVIIRGIIALIVICLDPLAIFLMAAVHSGSTPRRRSEAA
jgi:hypothetical protein